MPEDTVILPTPTPNFHHFIPTPTAFVSVIATPNAPAGVGMAEMRTAGLQVDWTLAALAAGVIIAGLSRLVRRTR